MSKKNKKIDNKTIKVTLTDSKDYDHQLDIIIPVRNMAGSIGRMICDLVKLIEPVKDQVKVIVVDDESEDNSGDVAKRCLGEFGTVIRRDIRGNIGGARNTGVQNSNSKYIMFLDADDFIDSTAIHDILERLEDDTDCIVWGFRKKTKTETTAETMVSWFPNYTDINQFPQTPVAAWLKAFKRELFVPFREGSYIEDCEWWFLLADQFNSWSQIQKPLLTYDRSGSSYSDATEWCVMHPTTLEVIAIDNILPKLGLVDSAPSDTLRCLAAMYDIRNQLKHPSVKFAWQQRFCKIYQNILTCRWSH